MQQESEQENKNNTYQQIMSRIRAFFNRDKFQFSKVRKYIVRKSIRVIHVNNQTTNDATTSNKANTEHGKRLASKSSDDHLNKTPNQLSLEEGLPEKRPSREPSMSGEEASLTQIVIAQIEHDNNSRNKKSLEWPQKGEPASRGTSKKNSLDKNQNGQEEKSNKSTSASPHSSEHFKYKLDAPLDHGEDEKKSEEPIYDVPPSKSLVNLNSSIDEGISLQKQHQIQVNGDQAYFHTSSPNIFLKVENEESIYDTPSTRSLAI